MKNLNRFFVTMIAFLFSFGIYFSNTAEAKANIELEIKDVDYYSNKCICYGIFKNTGDSVGFIKSALLKVTLTTYPDDEFILSFEREFDVNEYLDFTAEDSILFWTFETDFDDIPEYYGQYNWNVDNQIWWDSL